jgi:hypothetical protein
MAAVASGDRSSKARANCGDKDAEMEIEAIARLAPAWRERMGVEPTARHRAPRHPF